MSGGGMGDMMGKADSYTCSVCGGTFEKGWPDAEAQAEFAERFPGELLEMSELVCDDCWTKVMEWLKTPRGRELRRVREEFLRGGKTDEKE